MLDFETREKLQTMFYPATEDVVIRPVRKALDQYVQSGSKVLDAGCGKGTWLLRKYRSSMGNGTGVDAQHPKETMMNEFVSRDLENIPLKDSTFNIILCYHVIAYLKNHTRFLPNSTGYSLMMASWYSVPLVSILRYFVLLAGFPIVGIKQLKVNFSGRSRNTYFLPNYKCNTMRKIDMTLQAAGFRRETLETTENMYKYCKFNSFTYALDLIISRSLQSLPLAKTFRGQILSMYHK